MLVEGKKIKTFVAQIFFNDFYFTFVMAPQINTDTPYHSAELFNLNLNQIYIPYKMSINSTNKHLLWLKQIFIKTRTKVYKEKSSYLKYRMPIINIK